MIVLKSLRAVWAPIIVGIALWMAIDSVLPSNRKDKIADVRFELQNGDIVFVRSRTWRSFFVRFTGKTMSDFSHVGIVRKIDDLPFVIHAAPGTETVTIEAFGEFLSPAKKDYAEIYRLGPLAFLWTRFKASGKDTGRSLCTESLDIKLTSALKQTQHFAEIASREALGYFVRKIPFDHQFDISNVDKVYCTELVWLAYQAAGVDLGQGDPDFLSDSVIYGRALYPYKLSQSKWLTKVWDDF